MPLFLRRVLLIQLLILTLNYADTIDNLPSYQGFRGVVNTPNAEIQKEGEFELLYTNQIENLTPHSPIDFRNNKREKNYFLNMGIFPYLDVSLRYTYGINRENTHSFLSDRIISLKYQIPFIPKDSLQLAIGTQDLGGGARHLTSKYIVASKKNQNIRTSLGYARGDNARSLDGVFGSLEYQPFNWLLLGGEYDTQEWNGVVKVNYKTTVDNQKTNIGFMTKSSLDYNDIYFGIYANSLFNKKNAKSWSKFYETSERFKPTLTIEPDFILVDGSEYGHMNYSVALNSELSMNIFKNTIISTQYNLPLALSKNFKREGIFSYRNRHKTTPNIDQILLSQIIELDTSYPWVSLIQLGRFDKGLNGFSFESGLSSPNGKHRVVAKWTHLKDDLFNEMDLYKEEKREERLLSYQYHVNDINTNLKITGGTFLYGDQGVMFGLKRYFSNISVAVDVASTEHKYKGTNTIGRLTLSMPFGTNKELKNRYLNVKTGDITYVRRKTLVSKGETCYAQPHHLKEVNNHFTLENYYLSKKHF